MLSYCNLCFVCFLLYSPLPIHSKIILESRYPRPSRNSSNSGTTSHKDALPSDVETFNKVTTFPNVASTQSDVASPTETPPIDSWPTISIHDGDWGVSSTFRPNKSYSLNATQAPLRTLSLLPTSTGSGNCSGTLTSTYGQSTIIITSTVTSTVIGSSTIGNGSANAYQTRITEPPKCATEYVVAAGEAPALTSTAIVTDLVTKKSFEAPPAPSSVPPIYGGAPPSSQPQSKDGTHDSHPPSGKHPASPNLSSGGSATPNGGGPDSEISNGQGTKEPSHKATASHAKDPANGPATNPKKNPPGSSGHGSGDHQYSNAPSNGDKKTPKPGGSSSTSNQHHDSPDNAAKGSKNNPASSSYSEADSGSPGGRAPSSESGDGGFGGAPVSGNPAAAHNPSGSKDQPAAKGNGPFSGTAGNQAGNVNQYIPSSTNVGGVPIEIKPTEIFVGDHIVPIEQIPTTLVDHGQTYTVQQSQIIAPSTIIPLTGANGKVVPVNNPVNVDGIPVYFQKDRVVFGSTTIFPSRSTSAFSYMGKTYQIDGLRLVAPTTTVDLAVTPKQSLVTAGGQVFTANPSQLIAPKTTVARPQNQQPSPFTLNGQVFTINPSELILPDSTVKAPRITPPPSPIVAEGVTLSVGSSAVVVGSRTYPINAGQQYSNIEFQGHTINIGPDGIILASTTIPLPPSQQTSSVVTRGSLTLTLFPSSAIAAGHTYFLDSSSPATTTVIDGQLITIGPSGVEFEGTTAPLPSLAATSLAQTGPQPSVTVVDGISLTLGAGGVVINGTTYRTGKGSTPTTVAFGGESLSVGPGGIEAIETTGTPSATGTLQQAASAGAGAGASTLPSFDGGESGATRKSLDWMFWTLIWGVLGLAVAL
ncbi:MAG: hypothetical protein LQ351_002625 [Letrouitia transgressa]|nr:MAG: hypothetical protein LQ351_002625 [Letrouitia transgressa]